MASLGYDYLWSADGSNLNVVGSNVSIGTWNAGVNLSQSPPSLLQTSNYAPTIFVGNSNVGIGTTTPTHALHVVGDVYLTGNLSSPGGGYTTSNYVSSVSLSSVSPALTGTPTAPTASAGTNTTQLATTAFVTSAVNTSTSGLATTSSVTSAISTATTGMATSNYVTNYVSNVTSLGQLTSIGNGSSTTTIQGHLVASNMTVYGSTTTVNTYTTETSNLVLTYTGPGYALNVAGSTNFQGTVTGTISNATSATTATNVAAGTAGAVPYQSGAGATGFSAAGTTGQVLTSAGTGTPTWTTAASANTASAVVQRDASGNFIAGTIYSALSGNASTATSATSATTATNVAGGVAGAVHYQSGAGATGFSAAGTTGQVLTSAGTSAPTWTTASNANTASAIVQRDASGNFSAGAITASSFGSFTTSFALSGSSTTVLTSSSEGRIGFISFTGKSGAGVNNSCALFSFVMGVSSMYSSQQSTLINVGNYMTIVVSNTNITATTNNTGNYDVRVTYLF